MEITLSLNYPFTNPVSSGQYSAQQGMKKCHYPRKQVFGQCTLYLADCRVVLPTLQPVSHIITDPPYEEEAHTKGRRLLGKQKNGTRTVEYGALNFDPITAELRRSFCHEAKRLSPGWILAFCQAEAIAEWRASLVEAGCKWKRAMIWLKPDGAPQFTGDRPGMGYESISAAWGGAGRSSWNGGGRHGIFTHPQRENNNPKEHMTQKPVGLMCELISLFTNPGDIVLDPFMGSGTTGVACMKLERQFIGVEIDEQSFETACERMEVTYNQPTMFFAQPVRAEQVRLSLTD
jgi:site-specific DNA-methyltransferase (adenine-specific)